MKFLTSRMGGHVAGTGIEGYFDYKDRGYAPIRPRLGHKEARYPDWEIKLPNDDPKRWAELSGPCVTVVKGKQK